MLIVPLYIIMLIAFYPTLHVAFSKLAISGWYLLKKERPIFYCQTRVRVSNNSIQRIDVDTHLLKFWLNSLFMQLFKKAYITQILGFYASDHLETIETLIIALL